MSSNMKAFSITHIISVIVGGAYPMAFRRLISPLTSMK